MGRGPGAIWIYIKSYIICMPGAHPDFLCPRHFDPIAVSWIPRFPGTVPCGSRWFQASTFLFWMAMCMAVCPSLLLAFNFAFWDANPGGRTILRQLSRYHSIRDSMGLHGAPWDFRMKWTDISYDMINFTAFHHAFGCGVFRCSGAIITDHHQASLDQLGLPMLCCQHQGRQHAVWAWLVQISPTLLQEFHHFLVGGIPTPLKNMKVSLDDYSQYMESHKIHVPNRQPASTDPFFAATAMDVKPSEVTLLGSALKTPKRSTMAEWPFSAAMSMAVAAAPSDVAIRALFTSARALQSSCATEQSPNSAAMVKAVSWTLSVLLWFTSARYVRRIWMISVKLSRAAAISGNSPGSGSIKSEKSPRAPEITQIIANLPTSWTSDDP